MNPKDILQKEGFIHVYEWYDNAGTKYPQHAHKGRVTLFIINGEVTLNFSDATIQTIHAGERFDVPVGSEHTAVVGPNGCDYVVGEMIKGDS